MQLVEKHNIKKSHQDWKRIDEMCFYSKNLYNSALYLIKNSWEETGKIIWYGELDKKLRLENENYTKLPNNTSQQILMLVERNIKSYLELIKMWKANPSSLDGMPKFPHYKPKKKGRNILVFTSNQFKVKGAMIHFPKKCNIKPFKTNIKHRINQVRIVPFSDSYKLEIVYTIADPTSSSFNKHLGQEKLAGLDLGVNNLATVVLEGSIPFIVDGRELKSMNRYFNKENARMRSELDIEFDNKVKKVIEKTGKEKKEAEKEVKKIYSTKKLRQLSKKRNNKVLDYLHKSSRIIVDCLVENKIDVLVIGKNDGWKQQSNMGKINNQNFVQIPHAKFVEMIRYKCLMKGIEVHVTEEAYTSKCSSLDNEEMKHQEVYAGRRVKRGMFISNEGIKINADLNGALNIVRKVNPDKGRFLVQTLRIRGQISGKRAGKQVVWPVKVKLA